MSSLPKIPKMDAALTKTLAAHANEQKAWVRQRIKGAALEKIKSAFPRIASEEAASKFPELIHTWALWYYGPQPFDRSQPAERVKRLSAVERAANRLAVLARELQWGDLARDGDPGMLSGSEDLSLRRRAEALASAVRIEDLARASRKRFSRGPGRPSDHRRRRAVAELASIYKFITREDPTRRTGTAFAPEKGEPYGKPYGPFYDFALGCLSLVEGEDARVGLDDVIRRVLRPMGKNQFKSTFIIPFGGASG
jgi:hypothetical protein